MRFRKLLILILITILLFSLASCGKKKQDDPDPGMDLEPIPSTPTHSGKSVKGSPFVGSFSCTWSSVEHSPTDDQSWEGRISTLSIEENGTFTMTFDSLSDGTKVVMATVTGSVTVKDDTAACTVETRSTDDFLGSDVEDFTLVLIDSDNMRYRGDQQGMVGDRDIFTRNAG